MNQLRNQLLFCLISTFLAGCGSPTFKQALISPMDMNRNGFIDKETYQIVSSAVAISPLKSAGRKSRVFVNYSISFDQASLQHLNEQNWRQVEFPDTVTISELITETDQLKALKRISPSEKEKDYLDKVIRLQEQLQENACIQARLRAYFLALKTFEPIFSTLSFFETQQLPEQLFPPQKEYQRESLFMLYLIEERLRNLPFKIEFIRSKVEENNPLSCQAVVYVHKSSLMSEFESNL